MALSRVPRRTVAVLALLGALVLLASPAFAHAMVVSSSPGPGSLLKVAPRTVAITFDEAVTAVPDAVRVFGPDGSRVDRGGLLRPGGEGDTVGVAVGAKAQGTYLVSWRVVSADSHPVSGAFTFSVGRRTTAPIAPEVTSDTGLSKLLGIARACGYLGSAMLLGGSLLIGLAGERRPGTLRGRRRLLDLGVGALVGSSVVAILAQGAYDAGLGWSAIGDVGLVKDVLATTFGHGQLLRLAAAAAFALVLVSLRGTARVVLLVLAGVVLAASFAMTGHGVTSPLQFVSTSVHVAVASIWIGGLAVLVTLVAPQQDGRRAIFERFAVVAPVSVALLLITGTYQAWRQVGTWAALPATTYGRELLVKLGLVALALVAAAFSRRWVRTSGRRSAEGPVRTVDYELVLGMVVIGVTAVIATTMPATAAYHPSVATTLHTGPDDVRVSAVPVGDRTMSLDLYVSDDRQRPTDPAEVDVSVSLPDQNLGPLVIRMRKDGKGHLTGSVAVPVVGTWTLTVKVRTTAVDEYPATTDLPIR